MSSLGIVYALGAAAPTDIASAVPDGAVLTWLVPAEDPLAVRIQPVLRRSGTVVKFKASSSALDDIEWDTGPPQLDGVVTFSDGQVLQTAHVAEKFGLPFHSVSTARALTNKKLQRETLSRKGLMQDPSETVHSEEALLSASERLGFPVVLKPLIGVGSYHTYRLGDRADAVRAASRIPDSLLKSGMVIETLIVGRGTDLATGLADYVSVETFSLGGAHTVVAVVGRFTLAEPFRERGAVFPSGLSEEEIQVVGDYAVAAIDALGVEVGLCHVEIMLTAKGPQIIEVNGRLGGHVDWLIKRTGGPSLIGTQLEAALGIESSDAAWDPTGIAFRYLMPGPLASGTILNCRGVERARQLSGIERVVSRVQPGSRYDWRDGTASAVAEISGFTSTFPQIQDLVARCERTVSVELA